MRRSRFSEEQIVGLLKEHQAGGRCVGSTESATRRSTSWRSKYGGSEVSEAKRLLHCFPSRGKRATPATAAPTTELPARLLPRRVPRHVAM